MTRILTLLGLILCAMVRAGSLYPGLPLYPGQALPPAAAATPPTPDILWWKCNDGSGTTITADVGPNGTTDCDWITGKSGSGYAIRGNGSSKEAYTSSGVTFGTNILTVAAWVKINATPAAGWIWDSGDSGTNAFSFLHNSTWRGVLTGDSGRRTEMVALFDIGILTHLLVVYNGSTANGDVTIYTNAVVAGEGVAVNTKTGTSDIANGVVWWLSMKENSWRTQADLDDIRIYSGDQSSQRTNIMNDAQ